MKKNVTLALVIFIFLSTLAGCAQQNNMQKPEASDNSLPVPTVVSVKNTGTDKPAAASTSDTYALLIAHMTENYGKKSVTDFNTTLAPNDDALGEMLAAYADVDVPADDENYHFFENTLRFSLNELYCEKMGETCCFTGFVSKETGPYAKSDDGIIFYRFTCYIYFAVDYEILSPETLTIAERDATLLTFQAELQSYMDSLSEDEITDGDIRTAFTDKAAALAAQMSNDNIRLTAEISFIDLSDAR
ncbi:MAG: hypothetical protein K2I22_03850 [Lachnospiraceae bacterium]|nr:hypothetical protein [Lachnospiraceae bacterium]